MSGLSISVSEHMGGRARLPALQIVIIVAQWCTEVKRKPLWRALPQSLLTTIAEGLRGTIENMKENDERVCHVFWH